MSRISQLFLVIILNFFTYHNGNATSKPGLVDLARELQFHQAQSVVRGIDRVSINTTLSRMSSAILDINPDVSLDVPVTHAVIQYLLGGGNSSLLWEKFGQRRIIEKNSLLAGVLFFSDGDKVASRRHLEEVDPLLLPASVGGHIALLQAMLLEQSDSAERQQKLSLARLLLPGSIAEEAAIRQSAETAFIAKRFDDLLFMLEQYFRRFPTSVYSSAFFDRIIFFSTSIQNYGSPAVQQRFVEFLVNLSDPNIVPRLLTVCKDMLLGGKNASARQIAISILSRKIGDTERSRALLYLVASEPINTENEDLIKRLRNVSRSNFDSSDLNLLNMILRIQDKHANLSNVEDADLIRPSAEPTADDEFISEVSRRLSIFR